MKRKKEKIQDWTDDLEEGRLSSKTRKRDFGCKYRKIRKDIKDLIPLSIHLVLEFLRCILRKHS
jgi:hypothetical protein